MKVTKLKGTDPEYDKYFKSEPDGQIEVKLDNPPDSFSEIYVGVSQIKLKK